MVDEAQLMINTIKQIESSLDDASSSVDDGSLRITYPLNRCLVSLKEKYHIMTKLHRERLEQVQSKECASF